MALRNKIIFTIDVIKCFRNLNFRDLNQKKKNVHVTQVN